jgi:hypothetical protein
MEGKSVWPRGEQLMRYPHQWRGQPACSRFIFVISPPLSHMWGCTWTVGLCTSSLVRADSVDATSSKESPRRLACPGNYSSKGSDVGREGGRGRGRVAAGAQKQSPCVNNMKSFCFVFFPGRCTTGGTQVNRGRGRGMG